MSQTDAGTFWRTEPIHELLQRRGSYPYGLYPAIQYFNSTDKWSMARPYNRDKFEEMIQWCRDNCKGDASFSEAYGSFYFAIEQDRAMFRLFFADETMPEPNLRRST